MKTIIKIFAAVVGICAAGFAVVQAVYWLNVDNKFMFLIYKLLHKHYDTIPRDRKF